MKLIIDQHFWEVFPAAQIAILTVKGIDNHLKASKESYFADLLKKACKEAEKHIEEEPFTQNLVIKEWREAFTHFKTKKGARSSIEALLKRVSQGREFSPINPLVDLYNSISLRYGLPCGGEDLEKIVGDLHLGKAKGGESFYPLGAEEDSPALAEEIIYYDQEGAVCRNFNWREAQRTMLTEETQDAILVIESITQERASLAQAAIAELKQLIEDYFGVTGEIQLLTIENPEVEL
ncbi:B3/B4 domain-containing protein [Streptococcus ruminantium]|uniref:B3/B4 domain-containing protein n=1 Tax=Streptococcus ruminantium TaxID=1917441 RepID=UPI0012DC50AF|nr:phenylalanine--tRNA ligase beta subunit-related protein [Streptococcus ruminantium]